MPPKGAPRQGKFTVGPRREAQPTFEDSSLLPFLRHYTRVGRKESGQGDKQFNEEFGMAKNIVTEVNRCLRDEAAIHQLVSEIANPAPGTTPKYPTRQSSQVSQEMVKQNRLIISIVLLMHASFDKGDGGVTEGGIWLPPRQPALEAQNAAMAQGRAVRYPRWTREGAIASLPPTGANWGPSGVPPTEPTGIPRTGPTSGSFGAYNPPFPVPGGYQGPTSPTGPRAPPPPGFFRGPPRSPGPFPGSNFPPPPGRRQPPPPPPAGASPYTLSTPQRGNQGPGPAPGSNQSSRPINSNPMPSNRSTPQRGNQAQGSAPGSSQRTRPANPNTQHTTPSPTSTRGTGSGRLGGSPETGSPPGPFGPVGSGRPLGGRRGGQG